MKYLVIFHTYSGVMQLEKVLKKKDMIYETMPAPRALSTDCGVSIVFESHDVERFIKDIKTTNIHRIYLQNESYDLIFENA